MQLVQLKPCHTLLKQHVPIVNVWATKTFPVAKFTLRKFYKQIGGISGTFVIALPLKSDLTHLLATVTTKRR